MENQDFVVNFIAQYEVLDPAKFSLETHFKDIEGWSSLTALSIIAMVDEVYNVKLTGDDIRRSIAIEDIYNIVKERE